MIVIKFNNEKNEEIKNVTIFEITKLDELIKKIHHERSDLSQIYALEIGYIYIESETNMQIFSQIKIQDVDNTEFILYPNQQEEKNTFLQNIYKLENGTKIILEYIKPKTSGILKLYVAKIYYKWFRRLGFAPEKEIKVNDFEQKCYKCDSKNVLRLPSGV
ncbi:MAG: hypothetical protein ABIG64_09525 [Candidatus Omnitrophota bacterium]